MPSWGEVLKEFQESAAERAKVGQQGPDADGIRRKYLERLVEHTKRPVIVYYTDWVRGGTPLASIDLGDMQAMMEVMQHLKGPGLDIILHSPGGSAEATEAIVHYIRTKFSHVRVFVPLAAMSAATMWTLAADEIVMGKHSQLGPIDPQIQMGNMYVGVGAVRDQFAKALQDIATNPAALGAWAPILQQYGPGLLEMCQQADTLARSLVKQWLAAYMFRNHKDREARAEDIADFFGDHRLHQSHGRGIFRDVVRAKELCVLDLEEDQELQDCVLSVHHTAMLTVQGAGVVKLIENHLGRSFVLSQGVMQVQVPVFPPQAPPQVIPGRPSDSPGS